MTDNKEERIQNIPIDLIHQGEYQPRLHFSDVGLDELAEQMRSQGLIHPLILRPRPKDKGRFELIAGERRWRAAQRLGWSDIKAIVRNLNSAQAIAQSMLSNEGEPVTKAEQGVLFKRLQEEYQYTQLELESVTGLSRNAIQTSLYLSSLSSEVRGLIAEKTNHIKDAHGLLLYSLPIEQQYTWANKVVKSKLSVRDLRKALTPKKTLPHPTQAKDTDWQRMERDYSERLGAEFEILPKKKGAYVIQIKGIDSLDQLDGVLKHIK